MTAFYSLIAKVLFSGLDWYLRKKKMDAEMTKSYHEFLKQVDKKSLAQVANYMAAEEAANDLEEKIRKERLKREGK